MPEFLGSCSWLRQDLQTTPYLLFLGTPIPCLLTGGHLQIELSPPQCPFVVALPTSATPPPPSAGTGPTWRRVSGAGFLKRNRLFFPKLRDLVSPTLKLSCHCAPTHSRCCRLAPSSLLLHSHPLSSPFLPHCSLNIEDYEPSVGSRGHALWCPSPDEREDPAGPRWI